MKKERGSITIITIVTVLFILSFLVSTFVIIENRRQAQLEIKRETKDLYEKDIGKENEIYEKIISKMNSARLPNAYQEIEYIASTGTQYIDTGVKLDQVGYVVILDFQLTDTTNNKWFCGIDQTSTFEAGVYNNTLYTATGFTYSGNNLQNRMIATGNNTKTSTKTIYIFARNWSGNFNPASMKLYSCTITKNGEEIRNFVPCYRKSDGVTGLYDLCESICSLTGTPFYTNIGTGVFTQGDEI